MTTWIDWISPYIPKWTVIRSILESKLNASLALALFLVPNLPVLGLPVGPTTALLYLAAFVFFIALLLYSALCPNLVKNKTLQDFIDSGRSPIEAYNEFVSHGGSSANIIESDLKTSVEYLAKGDKPQSKGFWYVYEFINVGRVRSRLLISSLLLTAIFCLAVVNLTRAYNVLHASLPKSTPQNHSGLATHFGGESIANQTLLRVVNMGLKLMETRMSPSYAGNRMIGLVVGKNYDVEYVDGNGKSDKVTGKILDFDDSGYVIIETPNGQTAIPKERVVRIDEKK